MGLDGIIFTIAESPDLTNFGAASILVVNHCGGKGLVPFAGTTVNFLQEFGEFAGDVSGVAIQNWSVSSADLTWVIQDDDLSVERFAAFGGIVLRVAANVATTDFFDRDVFDVETDIVSWETLDQCLVVHFNACFNTIVWGGTS
jgi:hypothetical protein